MKIRKRWADGHQYLLVAVLMRHRYSEFEDLHQRLVQTFPHAATSMPQFPPKSVICKSDEPCSYPTCPISLSIVRL